MATSPDSHHSYDDEEKGHVRQLPNHWKFGGEKDSIRASRNPLILIRQILCLICFGYATLDPIWEGSHGESWKTMRNKMGDRFNHINVVLTLLLATISAFCTTEPPANSRILPYTRPIPYSFLLASLGSSIIGIAIGASAASIVREVNATWFREVLMGSARRVWTTIIVVCLQFIFTVLALWLFAAGLIIAAASSEVPFVKFGAGCFVIPPVVSGLAIIWFAVFRPGALWRLLKHVLDAVGPQDS